MSLQWNLADLFEATADAVADRTAIVCGDRRFTFRELDERATRLANHLAAHGVGRGDHVGLYLYNGPEYVEGTFAAYKLGAVPINVNYRYVEGELAYLFDNADLKALIHGCEFVDRIAHVAPDAPKLTVFVSVEDGTDADLATIGATAPFVGMFCIPLYSTRDEPSAPAPAATGSTAASGTSPGARATGWRCRRWAWSSRCCRRPM